MAEAEKEVKAPNLFERVKEEIEAVMHTDKSHVHRTNGTRAGIDDFNQAKAPAILERAKEPNQTKRSHNKETHGTSSEIDEHTPVDEVKAPNIFERAKEEVEAIVETIHPKKQPDHNSSSKKEGGFWGFLGRSLEKFCFPWDKKRN
ncbi:uncharacterized protein LOC143851429 [Tasmannia lanceolata]|uniref:uncharacterized protein LOC143851429 n=1 Tax=Tasmannia lanceolata TaxID=3420 RepID=UPI004064334D